MDRLSIGLTRTRALRDYRRRSGHSTQALLTLLVGAEAVKGGAEAPDDLPASWNPISRADAAGRARAFALQAALVWAAESLIGYMTSLTRSQPPVLQDNLTQAVRAERSRESKLVLLRSGLGLCETTASALTRSALVWRNKLTHVNATNVVDPSVRQFLLSSHQEIAGEYQGLDAGEYLARIQRGQAPRLKEAAAVNRAMAAVTRELDEVACRQVDVESYFLQILVEYLTPLDTRHIRAHGLWGGTSLQNRRSLLNVASQYGLRVDAEHGFRTELPDLSPRLALAYLKIS